MQKRSDRRRGLLTVSLGALGLLLLLAVVIPSSVIGDPGLGLLATVVRPNPDYIEINLGNDDTVAVEVSDAVGLYAVQLTLTFNPAHVQVVDADLGRPGVQVVPGPVLAGPDWYIMLNEADNTNGTITIVASLIAVENGYTGSGALFEARFLGTGAGSTSLTITDAVFSDRNGMSLPLTTQGGTIMIINGATLTPTNTPTPTATPTNTPVISPTPSPTEPARVAISPTHREVSVGMTTTVQIRIVDVTNLFGGHVHVSFDPSIVRIVDANPGLSGVQVNLGDFPWPDYVPVNEVDNTAGTIELALTQLPSRAPRNGDGVMSTLVFEALQAGISPVTITFSQLSDPEGIEILSTRHHGEIEVLRWGTVRGQVGFQGRSAPPAMDWVCPLSVTLHLAGDPSPAYTFSALCDQTGIFTVTDVLTEVYDVMVRDLHSLWSIKRNVHIQTGINPVDLGTLVEGDADVNKTVDILDFAALATAFGSVPADPEWDPRADFNNSLNIDVLDFALLATNYGLSGDVLVTMMGTMSEAEPRASQFVVERSDRELVTWPEARPVRGPRRAADVR